MPTYRTVSAADANRYFSKLLREVRDGGRVTITSHGRPVAEMVPVELGAAGIDRAVALAEMEARWSESEPMLIGTGARRP